MPVIHGAADVAFLDYMISHCCRMLAGSQTTDAQLHWQERLGFYLGKKKAQELLPGLS